LRKAAGLTQGQLAAATFTSRSSVACIETGRQNPDSAFWRRADDAMGAEGALVAAYDDVRALLRRQARAGVSSVITALVAQAPASAPLDAVPLAQGCPKPGIRAVLASYRPAAGVGADDFSGHDVLLRAPAAGRDHAGPPVASPAGFTGRPEERSHELFIRADALLAENDRREVAAAKVLLDRVIVRDPLFAPAFAARGYASWREYFAGWAKQSQALACAVSDVQAALEADPDSVVAHLTFVRVCWDMGWHEPALAAGRLVFSRHPDSLKAALAFARALNNAGLAQFALPLVDSVLTADPTNPAALRLRIWCYLMTGDFTLAAAAAEGYLPAHPADANTRWAAALAHQYLGDGASALRAAEDAAAADPGDITVWVLLGYLLRRLRGEAAAAERWRAGLAHVNSGDISSSRARAWLANLYAALGEERKALGIVDDLCSSEPANGYLHYRLAHVLAELGREDQAVGMLEQAVSCGFLSVQLAAREEVLATARISGSQRYRATMRRLEQRVAACADAYARDVLPAPVAGAASANWSSR
jgi:tetratricopeptide (TPR) repeat protein